jgi:hypothetical protein
MFSIQSIIVRRLGGSTAINTDTNKSQNNPGGGIGAQSSAVRRAISAKCQPSLKCNTTTTTVTPLTPIERAYAAATAASVAEYAANQAYEDAFDEMVSIPSQLESAESYVSSAETSAYNASVAPTTAMRYAYYLEASQNAAAVTASHIAIQESADTISAYSSVISTNAAIAHDNYVIAQNLQDSI